MENAYVDPMATTATNQALSVETKENVSDVAWTIQSHEVKITRLNMELEQARKQVTIPMVHIFTGSLHVHKQLRRIYMQCNLSFTSK